MRSPCQLSSPFAVAVAGVAGSGKSTLGRALASTLRAPLLDLDTLTNPLLDALGEPVFGGHWLASAHAADVREGRYAALLSTAADVLATAGGAVLVAPFTSELAGGPAWDRMVAALSPATPRVVQLVAGPELLARRRAGRRTERDLHRLDAGTAAPAAVPVLTLDAALRTAEQLALVMADLQGDEGGGDRSGPVGPPLGGEGTT